jgi:hypothetical protein
MNSAKLLAVEANMKIENQGSREKNRFFKMHRQRTSFPAIRTSHIARSGLVKYFFIAPETGFLSAVRSADRRYLGMQAVLGRHGGSGSPPNCLATPNAAPITTNSIPAMIFAFTVPLHAAVAAWHGF